MWEPPQATTSESESATRATTSATRATTRLLPVRAVRERPLGSLPPRALGICVPELEPDSELTRTMAIMISFKLGKRQNRGSRAPIMIDRVSRRSARVLLCCSHTTSANVRFACDLQNLEQTHNPNIKQSLYTHAKAILSLLYYRFWDILAAVWRRISSKPTGRRLTSFADSLSSSSMSGGYM